MLQLAIDWFTYTFLGLNSASRLAQGLNFFLYDSIKILLLLFLLISVVGFLRSYISQKKVKRWLSKKEGLSNLFAALFGAVTPFCSCSSIPIFLGFIEAGVPLGAAFSFLITSPLINEYLVILMLGFFGVKITFFYILSGIILGVFSGLILGRSRLEKYLIKDVLAAKADEKESIHKNFKSRILFGLNEGRDITRRLWLWVLLGVGIGAVIHNLIPEAFIHSLIGKTGFFSVPLAALLGVPLYGSCAAIVPIAVVLFQKGIPLGTALSFMMAVSALSFPEAILLRRAMKLQLIVIFFSITALGIIFTGYLFNFLQLFIF